MKPSLFTTILILLVAVQATCAGVERATRLEQPWSVPGGESSITPVFRQLKQPSWRTTTSFQGATSNITSTNTSTQQTQVIVATPSDTVKDRVEAPSKYVPPLWWLGLAVSLIVFAVLAGPILVEDFRSRWRGRREPQR